MSSGEERYFRERARIEQGHTKYREKLREEGKLFVRDRLKLLFDPGAPFQEDWLFARSAEADTPADGVVTGVGQVGGRPVCVMANDYTVKAGSWGEKTVQKIVRIQEKAARLQVDRKSTRLNSSHTVISYAVFCLKKKKANNDKSIHQMLT